MINRERPFSSKTLLDLLVHLFMVIASEKKNCEKNLYTYSVQSYTRLFTFLWAKLFFQFFSSKSLLDLLVHLCMVIASEKKKLRKKFPYLQCATFIPIFLCVYWPMTKTQGEILITNTVKTYFMGWVIHESRLKK